MIEHHQKRNEEEVSSLFENTLREAVGRFPILKPHVGILEFVFKSFYRRDGLIFFEESEEGCSIEPAILESQYIYHLHIGILNREDPITLLWSILHEYGHALQDFRTETVRKDPTLTLERETDAWNKAEQALTQFNLSPELLESFSSFRMARLQKYKDRIKA